MYVSNGSIVKYLATWKPFLTDFAGNGYTSPSEQESQMNLYLSNAGFVVLQASNDSGFFNVGETDTTFTWLLKINTGTDYASEDDVKSILDHAVIQGIGRFPISSSLPQIQSPPSQGGQTTSTGQPDTGASALKDKEGQPSGPSWFDSLSKFLEGASVGTLLGIGLMVVAIILIVGYLESRKLI
jgi:hypothetical protein